MVPRLVGINLSNFPLSCRKKEASSKEHQTREKYLGDHRMVIVL
jgi:hypothetical protein